MGIDYGYKNEPTVFASHDGADITRRLFFPDSILQNHLVNNITAVDASPAEKGFVRAVEFFVRHHATASGTLHLL